MVPVLDLEVKSFLDQVSDSGKRIIFLVEGLTPRINVQIKGKDAKSIYDEIQKISNEPKF